MPIVAFHQLRTWRKAFALTLTCHRLASRLPANERYLLGAQIRSASASIPANIAEGNGRMLPGDYLRFLRMAHGSLMELQTHLFLASALAYVPRPVVRAAFHESCEVGRLLGRLMTSIEARTRSGPGPAGKRKGPGSRLVPGP